MRTLVTFESAAFNTSQLRDYFINPGCFGDDTCRWLMERLRQAGVTTDPEPGQEDFGWYFDFTVPEGEHCCVVAFRPSDSESDPGTWVAWIERERSFLGSLLGGRNRGIASAAVSAIHRALLAPEVAKVRWHERSDFDRGQEEHGSKDPGAVEQGDEADEAGASDGASQLIRSVRRTSLVREGCRSGLPSTECE